MRMSRRGAILSQHEMGKSVCIVAHTTYPGVTCYVEDQSHGYTRFVKGDQTNSEPTSSGIGVLSGASGSQHYTVVGDGWPHLCTFRYDNGILVYDNIIPVDISPKSLAVAPNERLMVTLVDQPQGACFYDVWDGFYPVLGHNPYAPSGVSLAQFSNKSKYLLLGNQSSLSLIDVDDGDYVGVAHTLGIRAFGAAFAPDDRRFVITVANEILLYAVEGGSIGEIASYSTSPYQYGNCVYSPDGRYMVAVSGNRVQVYIVIDRSLMPSGAVTLPKPILSKPAFSQNGKYLAISCAGPAGLLIFSIADGGLIEMEIDDPPNGNVGSCSFATYAPDD